VEEKYEASPVIRIDLDAMRRSRFNLTQSYCPQAGFNRPGLQLRPKMRQTPRIPGLGQAAGSVLRWFFAPLTSSLRRQRRPPALSNTDARIQPLSGHLTRQMLDRFSHSSDGSQ